MGFLCDHNSMFLELIFLLVFKKFSRKVYLFSKMLGGKPSISAPKYETSL